MSKRRSKQRAARMVANKPKPVNSNQIEKSNQAQNQSGKMIATRLQRTETLAFSGPLPLPEHLERYGEIVENGAERIFKMAEAQMDHRLGIEKNLVQSDIRRANMGLFYGFVIALVVTGSGTWITLQGRDPLGLIAMLTPLVSIIALFIYNRQAGKKDNEEPPPKEKKKR